MEKYTREVEMQMRRLYDSLNEKDRRRYALPIKKLTEHLSSGIPGPDGQTQVDFRPRWSRLASW